MTTMVFNPNQTPLLAVEDLVVAFPLNRRERIHAVSGVSFTIRKGETLGLVGESGCGKSTVARSLVRLQDVDAGRILFEGEDIVPLKGETLRRLRPQIQMIFQNATASLNPGRSVGRTIAEPLRVGDRVDERKREDAARAMMAEVGLDPALFFNRKPFAFSGGQCQRISIARALITRPKLLICDEPVSSLDVSIQAQILNLIRRLKARHELTLLFISHDLAVVKNICDRVAVMFLGKLCEIAGVEDLFRRPFHPFSMMLMQAVAKIGLPPVDAVPHATAIAFPSPAAPPPGCRFHPRCRRQQEICRESEPPMKEHEPGRWVACHFPIG